MLYIDNGSCEVIRMGAAQRCQLHWVYWSRLYNSRFQAGCIAKRMEEDWWIYGLDCPREVEVIQTRRGRFGVRYLL